MKRFEVTAGIGKDKDGNPIADIPHKGNAIVEEACRKFGGCTVVPCYGGWIDEKGELTAEEGRVFIVCYAESVSYNFEILPFARRVRDSLNQSCVVLHCDNDSQFI